MNILKLSKLRIFKLSKGQSLVKGQSLIIQFVIFFLIGITLFIGLSSFFRLQSENLREDLVKLSLEMINSYISSMVVSSVDSCVNCGVIENKVHLGKTYAGYFIEINLNESGLAVATAPRQVAQLSSINNLNESFDPGKITGSASSVKTINLTYNRNQNKLEVNDS